MAWENFKDPSKRYSVVLFVQESDFKARQKEIEQLGNQRNVRLVVQPCPYEGIEFLSRVGHQLVGSEVSTEKDLYWLSITLKGDVPDATFQEISTQHYEYLCAILEQEVKKVEQKGKLLRNYIEQYA